LVKLVHVYVNGQLLVSGSTSDVNGSDADYELTNTSTAAASNNDIRFKFAFDLERDDSVVVIAG